MANKIVITGAGGFIGSHLVDFLITKYPSSSLRLLVSPRDKLLNLSRKELDIVRGDIRNKNFVNKSVKGADIIYHLAAYTGFESDDYEDFKEVNVDGTKNILEAVDERLQKFIFFSTIAVYGLPPWIGDIKNFNEKQSYNPTEKYGRSKMEAEILVKKSGIPYSILRPVSVYGPRDKGQIYSLYKAIKNKTFIFIGNGKNKMHYIYVDDLVKAAYLSQQSKLRESDYILGDNEPITLNELVSEISKSINSEVPYLRIPLSLGLFLGYSGLVFEKVTKIPSPIFPSRVRVMTRTWYYDISKAKTELGFDPKINFKKGAKLTGKWLLDKET
jgi:GlcNAc-P-P-Und epimerase